MPVSGFFVLVVIVVVALLALALLQKASRSRKLGLPYEKAEGLFSPAERQFLNVLDAPLGSDYRIFGKVRIGDIAKVKPGLGASARQGALNRIAYKHFDYVVCRRSDLAVVCVVELNDKSHSTSKVAARDGFVNDLCKTIEVPLLSVQAKRAYSQQELRTAFEVAVSPVKKSGT
jgi:Protein of unknown function (DUF2726)